MKSIRSVQRDRNRTTYDRNRQYRCRNTFKSMDFDSSPRVFAEHSGHCCCKPDNSLYKKNHFLFFTTWETCRSRSVQSESKQAETFILCPLVFATCVRPSLIRLPWFRPCCYRLSHLWPPQEFRDAIRAGRIPGATSDAGLIATLNRRVTADMRTWCTSIAPPFHVVHIHTFFFFVFLTWCSLFSFHTRCASLAHLLFNFLYVFPQMLDIHRTFFFFFVHV